MLRTFQAALPIMIGYIALGIPCGILCAKAGMSLLQIVLLSTLLYSGSGQYMIASMTLGGVSPVSMALSVALVNSRQLLYASALLPFFSKEGRAKAVLAASNVTDESFGVNVARYLKGDWSALLSFGTNLWSQISWLVANVIGALLGALIVVDTALAAFAMTAIFACLLLMQKGRIDYLIAGLGAALMVVVCKLTGLSNVAIFLGAVFGVVCGSLTRVVLHINEPADRDGEADHAVE